MSPSYMATISRSPRAYGLSKRGKPPTPPPEEPDPEPELPPEPPGPCLKSELKNIRNEDGELPQTDIVRLCSESSLPMLVEVREQLSAEGSPVKLTRGDRLLLHYVVEEVCRVHAMDANKAICWLPVHHKQKYERLPIGE